MNALIYLSKAIHEFNRSELDLLCEQSGERNAQQGITGYLCYSKQRFIQYIEGEAEALEKLFTSISSDTRHEVLSYIHKVEIKNRLFPSWGMRYVETENSLSEPLDTSYSMNFEVVANQLRLSKTAEKTVYGHIDILSRRALG